MTVAEFSNEFDIYYNSISTNSSPNVDAYEKSVYLTKAQLEIVNNYFNPRGNKYGQGFEQSSKRRFDLNELVRPGVSTAEASNFTDEDKISEDSQFFTIPLDLYMFIQESAKVFSEDACINNTYLDVVPKTHDEYNNQIKNPFKKPEDSVVWRLDIYSKEGLSQAEKAVELISPHTVTEYKFRYIIRPEPIVLVDLAANFPYENLSIDGVTDAQTCKLSDHIHREILNRAVEMAVADLAPGKLQQKLTMNARNE